MMMKGPCVIYPDWVKQTIRLRLHPGFKPRRIRLLAAAKMITAKRDGDFLIAKVPSILDHEVLAIDL